MSEPAEGTTDFLTDVATYLAANGVGSVSGSVNIFAGQLPATPDNAVGIIGNSGEAPNPYVPQLLYPRFQITIRNTDYDTGWQKLRAIRDLLHGKFGLQFTNFHALSIYADAEGGALGEDTNGRHVFSINFRAEVRDGSA